MKPATAQIAIADRRHRESHASNGDTGSFQGTKAYQAALRGR
jgi:hypothetical protein